MSMSGAETRKMRFYGSSYPQTPTVTAPAETFEAFLNKCNMGHVRPKYSMREHKKILLKN